MISTVNYLLMSVSTGRSGLGTCAILHFVPGSKIKRQFGFLFSYFLLAERHERVPRLLLTLRESSLPPFPACDFVLPPKSYAEPSYSSRWSSNICILLLFIAPVKLSLLLFFYFILMVSRSIKHSTSTTTIIEPTIQPI